MTKLACLKKRLKNKKGFTLVELLVVLAIMAILIAVAVPTMTGALNDAKDKVSMSDARTAFIAYTLKKTTADTVTNKDIATYMDKIDSSGDIVGGIACSLKEDAKGNVVEFYFTNTSLGATKHIKIVMGNKASVVTSALPSGTGIVVLS